MPPEFLTYRYDGDRPGTTRRARVLADAVAITFIAEGDAPIDPFAKLNALLDAATRDNLKALMGNGELEVVPLPDMRAIVLRARAPGPAENLIAALRASSVAHALRVEPGLGDATGTYLLYSPGLIVVRLRAAHDLPPAWLEGDPRWRVLRPLAYAAGAFVLEPGDPRQQNATQLAHELSGRGDVRCAYPVLVQGAGSNTCCRPRSMPWTLGPAQVGALQIDSHANVLGAWRHTCGEGVTVAVVERGPIDAQHPAIRDRVDLAVDVSTDPAGVPMRRLLAPGDPAHGTWMAGAVASGCTSRAPGVAPRARLLLIELGHSLGSLAEGDGIHLAASRGAGVITCSWGPELLAGVPQDPPPHTCWAIEAAVERGGPLRQGSVVVFSAGNEGGPPEPQSLDQNGYACHPCVIAVGASNTAGVHASYSNAGRSLWCVFPSGGDRRTIDGQDDTLLVLDPAGEGGEAPQPSPQGDYDEVPGQTSTACAGTAGVVALMLSVNPQLRPYEVRALLALTCARIDLGGGGWTNGWSTMLGHGRIDAGRAVECAMRLTRGGGTKPTSPPAA